MSATARDASAPSRQVLRRAALCEDIHTRTPIERDRIGYQVPMLAAQTCLPHRDPGPEKVWTSKHGKAFLTATSGQQVQPDGRIVDIGLPWGIIPRLILIFIATAVKRFRRPEIDLGENLTEFLRLLGLPRHSHHYRAVPEQLRRLLNANIRYQFSAQGATGSMEVISNRPVADDYFFWWDTARPDQHTLWRSYVVLHKRFFENILEHGFPIDLDAVRVLHQSALALDLYSWLAYRTHPTGNRQFHRDILVPWSLLHEQVGSSYTDLRDFKKRAKRALAAIGAAYRALRIDYYRGGLVLKPSLPPVLPRVPLRS